MGFGGVPVGAVAFGGVLGLEDLEVDGQAFGFELLVDGAEGVDLELARGAGEHLAGEDNYLSLWLLGMESADEFAVGFGVDIDVVAGGAQVVGAEVYADYVGAEAFGLPHLGGVVDAGVVVPIFHGFAGEFALVITVEADAGTSHAHLFGEEFASEDSGVGVVVVGVVEGIVLVLAFGFAAVAAGDGVADELDSADGG